MCGILGFVDFAYRHSEVSPISKMLATLSRRGPDGSGIVHLGPCQLGHTRLSIIDLEGSPQPMTDSQSGLTLSYNGELYNYTSLRQRLQSRGYAFKTDGDTEVVLKSLADDWEQSFSRYDGMFAIAAWNPKTNQLILARDPIGEKPVFYANPEPGLIIFGSEIKAILAHPSVKSSLSLPGVRQSLRFRTVYGDGTLYEGIFQLRPGHYLVFSEQGLQIKRYFNLGETILRQIQNLQCLTDSDVNEIGRNLLTESVTRRLVADVPVGVFLSGGLDSSLITALVRKIRGTSSPLETFSVGFSGDEFSEIGYARTVAKHFHTNHHELIVSAESYIRRLAELSHCRDGPVSEPADIAIAELSHLAKKSVKVVLSGEGADEVFAGYPKYAFANRNPVLHVLGNLPYQNILTYLPSLFGVDQRRLQILLRAQSQSDDTSRFAQWFSYFDRVELRNLYAHAGWSNSDWLATMQPHCDALKTFQNTNPLQQMQFLDCMTWLPSNLLERGDRMTMAEGLELRPPFLFKDLVSFGVALATRLKVSGRIGKQILRSWAQSEIPAEILNRKKWGFRVPLNKWFYSELGDMFLDLTNSSHSFSRIFGSHTQAQRLLSRHRSGRQDLSLSLWTILTMESWYQTSFTARGAQMVV